MHGQPEAIPPGAAFAVGNGSNEIVVSEKMAIALLQLTRTEQYTFLRAFMDCNETAHLEALTKRDKTADELRFIQGQVDAIRFMRTTLEADLEEWNNARLAAQQAKDGA